MAKVGTCVVAVFLVIMVTGQNARVRRGEYLLDSGEDASIAGDYIVGVGADCSDDDSESLELGYVIINKREAPEVRESSLPAQTAAASPAVSQPLPNTKPVAFV